MTDVSSGLRGAERARNSDRANHPGILHDRKSAASHNLLGVDGNQYGHLVAAGTKIPGPARSARSADHDSHVAAMPLDRCRAYIAMLAASASSMKMLGATTIVTALPTMAREFGRSALDLRSLENPQRHGPIALELGCLRQLFDAMIVAQHHLYHDLCLRPVKRCRGIVETVLHRPERDLRMKLKTLLDGLGLKRGALGDNRSFRFGMTALGYLPICTEYAGDSP